MNDTFLPPFTSAFTCNRFIHPEDGGNIFLWNTVTNKGFLLKVQVFSVVTAISRVIDFWRNILPATQDLNDNVLQWLLFKSRTWKPCAGWGSRQAALYDSPVCWHLLRCDHAHLRQCSAQLMLLLADCERRPAATAWASLRVPPLFSLWNKITMNKYYHYSNITHAKKPGLWSHIPWPIIIHALAYEHTLPSLWSYTPWHMITHSPAYEHKLPGLWSHIPWPMNTLPGLWSHIPWSMYTHSPGLRSHIPWPMIIHYLAYEHTFPDIWPYTPWPMITHSLAYDHIFPDLWTHTPWPIITHFLTYEHTFPGLWTHTLWPMITHSLAYDHTFPATKYMK